MRWSSALVYTSLGAIFIFLYIFYVHLFPLIPYNGDDWRYLSQYRSMMPSLRDWNPARVFPEIIFPILGYVAAYLVLPLSGDYIGAICQTFGTIISLFIIALCMSLYNLVENISSSKATSILCMFLFIILSFLIFKNSDNDNVYLFYSPTLTQAVYYLIPNILNSIIVICILRVHFYSRQIKNINLYMSGCAFLLVYFAQFSMTFSSAISTCFAALFIILRIWHVEEATCTKKIKIYIKNIIWVDKILIFAVTCWIISAVFDASGSRFASLSQQNFDLFASIEAFYNQLYSMRSIVYLLTALVFLGSICLLSHRKYMKKFIEADKKMAEALFIICTSMLLVGCLYILIGARTSPNFSGNISAIYGVFFFQILLTVICIAYLLTKIHLLKILAPALLVFLFIETTNSQKKFAVQYTETHLSIVKHWIEDARKANMTGENVIIISVPKIEWPHPQEWFGEVFAHTLFAHGIISHPLQIKMKEIKPLSCPN